MTDLFRSKRQKFDSLACLVGVISWKGKKTVVSWAQDWKNIVDECFTIIVVKIAGVWGNVKSVERNVAKHFIQFCLNYAKRFCSKNFKSSKSSKSL